jgi:hypothetical protein
MMTSENLDHDLGGKVSGCLVVENKGLRANEGTSARNRVRGATRPLYIYHTLRKLVGLCPNCEGGIVGHGRTRGSLYRATVTCECGWHGTGRELEEPQWFTTTIQ